MKTPILLFAICIGIIAVVLATLFPYREPGEAGYRDRDVISDVRSLQPVLVKYATDHHGVVPKFSSGEPPTWFAHYARLVQPYPPAELALQRPWTYEVPAGMVGRSIESLGPRELLIEVRDRLHRHAIIGVNVNNVPVSDNGKPL